MTTELSSSYYMVLSNKGSAKWKQQRENQTYRKVIDKIIGQGYKTLPLEYFFTAGLDEVKTRTVQKGTEAPQTTGKNPHRFRNAWGDKIQCFKEDDSEILTKAAGKYRQQGR